MSVLLSSLNSAQSIVTLAGSVDFPDPGTFGIREVNIPEPDGFLLSGARLLAPRLRLTHSLSRASVHTTGKR